MRAIKAIVFGAAAIGVVAASATFARPAPRHYGVYRAIVTEAADPEGRHRVKVTIPAISGASSMWAERSLPLSIAVDAALPPRTGSEVVVAFEAGDTRRPIVLGALWSRD